jgi:hypothetical protein
MPAKGDGITKRKDGRYMARYTVHTQDGPKRISHLRQEVQGSREEAQRGAGRRSAGHHLRRRGANRWGVPGPVALR